MPERKDGELRDREAGRGGASGAIDTVQGHGGRGVSVLYRRKQLASPRICVFHILSPLFRGNLFVARFVVDDKLAPLCPVVQAVVEHDFFHALEVAELFQRFDAVTGAAKDEPGFERFHAAVRAVGEAKGPDPVKPAFEFCRSLGPEYRVHKDERVGIVDSILLGPDFRRTFAGVAVIGIAEVFRFGNVSVKVQRIEVGHRTGVARIEYSADKRFAYRVGAGGL